MHASTMTTLSGLLAVAALGLTGSDASAQSNEHIHRLARQIEQQARELHREVDAHARNMPQYAHLHRDVSEMERLAAHIHEVVDRRGSIHHIRADVRRLDRLLHHVEEVFDDVVHSGRISRQAIRHIRRALERLSDTVHHLRDDLR